jgi:lipoate-protein ligase A
VWLEVLTESGVIGHLAPEEFPFPSPRSGPFFCFEKPGRTDLLLDGGKLLGSAQRRVPGHVLQHGSLILGRRFASHPGAHLGDPPADRVDAWSERFVSILSERLDLAPRAACWTSEQLEEVARRRDVYASEDWTRRR